MWRRVAEAVRHCATTCLLRTDCGGAGTFETCRYHPHSLWLMHILIVESDSLPATQLGDYFEQRGHSTDYAAHETLAMRLADAHDFDAIILSDRKRLDALALCRRLRKSTRRQSTILVVGELPSVEHTIAAFDAGSDDYLARPVAFAELHARLNALIRRRRTRHDSRLAIGDLELDAKGVDAWRGGRRLELSPTEFKLLRILVEAAPETVTYNELEICLWGRNRGHLLGTNVRSQVYNLRRIVDQPFDYPLIQTRRQLGYRIVVPDGSVSIIPYRRRKKASVAAALAETCLQTSPA